MTIEHVVVRCGDWIVPHASECLLRDTERRRCLSSFKSGMRYPSEGLVNDVVRISTLDRPGVTTPLDVLFQNRIQNLVRWDFFPVGLSDA